MKNRRMEGVGRGRARHSVRAVVRRMRKTGAQGTDARYRAIFVAADVNRRTSLQSRVSADLRSATTGLSA
jgi:hypothetical protein